MPNTTPVTADTSKTQTFDFTSQGISYTTDFGSQPPGIPTRDTSQTQFFRQQRYEPHEFERITREEYLGLEESVSRNTLSYDCLYGKGGKVFSSRGRLKRLLTRQLDPQPTDPAWTSCLTAELCEPSELAATLVMLIQDATRDQQLRRLRIVLDDFVATTTDGFNLKDLDHVCVILNYLVDNLASDPSLRPALVSLLEQIKARIHMDRVSDAPRFFDMIRNYITFLGYLLMCLEDDTLFDLVSEGVLWQLTANREKLRGGSIPEGLFCDAADTMNQITARMLALATPHRFRTYLDIALLLAHQSKESCLAMMDENVIENIFYRFDPYFPEKLPPYEINPANPQDDNIKLGVSSIHLSRVMSLLLILLPSTAAILKKEPLHRPILPCPDDHAQSAFIWAYRLECRARDHKHERITLTAIVEGLLQVYGKRLVRLSRDLMPDVMSLSVQTELPPREDWTATVVFNTGPQDAQFKKSLLSLSLHFLQVFPKNDNLVKSRNWLLGMMYLLDPGLSQLRVNWSPPLFEEIRKILMQVLVVALPLTDARLVQQYGLIRRTLWYIEWYTEQPYELPTLYWCVRLLQVSLAHRSSFSREVAVGELRDTHGIIILIQLCYTLMAQKFPPVEKAQAILGLTLRILTSALEVPGSVTCTVYPRFKWPRSCLPLATKMIEYIVEALERGLIISDRLLVAVLNFIWQAIVWRDDARKKFLNDGGIYKLLDLITMVGPSAQCIALAVVCDVARAGEAVDQLVTWRAGIGASKAHPAVTKRGSNIAALLASVFRDECRQLGVKLDCNGVIIDEQAAPLSSVSVEDVDAQQTGSLFQCPRTPVCFSAADLAGSRMSKAFALLSLLSEDLKSKVSLLDESFNLYKNVPLTVQDEVTLVLCSHFLTLKLSETWREVKWQCKQAFPPDYDAILEFDEIGKGWTKEVKRLQEDVLNKRMKIERQRETSLYEFLARVRLTIALDALRELRCVVRTADYTHLHHALIQDAVYAHHKRESRTHETDQEIIKTYVPKLDAKNMTAQYRKVYSTLAKEEIEISIKSPQS